MRNCFDNWQHAQCASMVSITIVGIKMKWIKCRQPTARVWWMSEWKKWPMWYGAQSIQQFLNNCVCFTFFALQRRKICVSKKNLEKSNNSEQQKRVCFCVSMYIILLNIIYFYCFICNAYIWTHMVWFWGIINSNSRVTSDTFSGVFFFFFFFICYWHLALRSSLPHTHETHSGQQQL